MRLVKVKELPPKEKRPYPDIRNDLIRILTGFVQDTDAEIVRVEYGYSEYVDMQSCRASLVSGIKRLGFPIAIRIINDDIYLIKK